MLWFEWTPKKPMSLFLAANALKPSATNPIALPLQTTSLVW
jgi:hypothetical protein